jgi:phosphoglucomutase
MVAECAAWCASRGKTLFDFMQDIYGEFGFYKEGLFSVVRQGESGAGEIKSIMDGYRKNPPKSLGGSPVTKVIDYMYPEMTGMPKSNVLQFFAENGSVVSVRPSGTEPKIKFYFEVRGDNAESEFIKLKAQFER